MAKTGRAILHPLFSILVSFLEKRPALASAVLALALYAITLGGTYVYDDRYIIETDPRIKTVAGWKELWTKDYFNGGVDNLYRPLVSMTYAVQTWLHGNDEASAWAFHLINWLMNAGVAALVATFAKRLTGNARIALLSGLLFAAHPIHVEVAANVVGRAELMCALGILGAMVLMLHRPMTIPRAFGIAGCLVLALLSKEQGMLLPLMLLAIWPVRQRLPGREIAPELLPSHRTKEKQALLVLLLLVCWIVAAYVYVRENVFGLKFWWAREFLDWTINPIIQSTGRDRLLMPFLLLGRYAQLLIAPIRLSLDYGFDVMNAHVRLSDPYFVAGVLTAVVGVAGGVIAIVKRAWPAFVCLFGFALFFGLVSNSVTIIGTNLSERLMYTPSVFICILIAMALAQMPKPAMVTLASLLLVLGSLRTVTYAALWNDRVALYRQTLAEKPQSVRLHMVLAYELQESGDFPAADAVLARARASFPQYWRVWESSGLLALKMDDLPLAERYYAEGATIYPAIQRSSLASEIAKRQASSKPTR